MNLEPGMIVHAPTRPEWGEGQVQSVVGEKVTVTFAEVGRIVLDTRIVHLEYLAPDTYDQC